MNRKQKIIVSVTGIVIIVLALIGFTYGFFLTRITGNPTSPSISIDTANLAVHYSEDTNVIQGASDATPGYTVTKTFNVENVGDGTAEYSIKLKDIVSTFSRLDDWTYTLKQNGEVVAEGFIPTMDTKVIISAEQIEVNAKHSYELTLKYAELSNVNQTEDMGKTIYMTVNIDTSMNTWNGVKKVNQPKLSEGMIPVKWNDTSGKWVVCSETDEEWYDYDNKKWANVMLSDGKYKAGSVSTGQEVTIYETGSMFVWIPKYEYKITDQTIDVKFISLTQTTPTSGYKIHPAFVSDINVGGWDTELNGIWFAKYEAGYQKSTINTDVANPINASDTVVYSNYYYTSAANTVTGTQKMNAVGQNIGLDNYSTQKISYPVFKASTYSYNLINMNDMFLVSRDMGNSSYFGLNNADTHMIKNTEWGAAAYLAHSKYGRNGTEVSVNTKNLNPDKTISALSNIDIYTISGYTGDTIAISNATSAASSTGNMTGIFDMSGGATDRIAMYSTGNDVDNARVILGASLTQYDGELNTIGTKYATPYDIDYRTNLTAAQIFDPFVASSSSIRYGDAVIETIISPYTHTGSWNNDYSIVFMHVAPFVVRGGRMDEGDKSGIFAISHNNGNATSSKTGFRVALVVE